jgi:hypothetical protein
MHFSWIRIVQDDFPVGRVNNQKPRIAPIVTAGNAQKSLFLNRGRTFLP